MEIVINFPTNLEHKVDETLKHLTALEEKYAHMENLYFQKTGEIFNLSDLCAMTEIQLDDDVYLFIADYHDIKLHLTNIKTAIRNSFFASQDFAVIRMNEDENSLLYLARYAEKAEVAQQIDLLAYELEKLPDYVEPESALIDFYKRISTRINSWRYGVKQ